MKIIKTTLASFLNEAVATETDGAYSELKEAILKMVEDSISSTDPKLTKEFLEAYIKDDEKTLMVGFVNDSDIYDFYIKYTDLIDQILMDLNYFDEAPIDNNLYGVYDYVVGSTKIAVKKFVESLVKEF